MSAVHVSRVVAIIAGLGLMTAPVIAQQQCGGGPAGPYCPDKKIYPRLESFYIKKFCGPTIAPGSCFGHFKTNWRSWDDACPGGNCNTAPGVSVYALPPAAISVETPPDVKADPDPIPPATDKSPDGKTDKTPDGKPPVTKPKEDAPLPKPKPLPTDPKKDDGKSSLNGAPSIRLPAAPMVSVQTPLAPTTPILVPPVGGQ